MVYAIKSSWWNDSNGTPYFLAWQPYDYDDGYFWTQKTIFLQLVHSEYNIAPHRFTFTSKKEAIQFARKIQLKNYKIVRLED